VFWRRSRSSTTAKSAGRVPLLGSDLVALPAVFRPPLIRGLIGAALRSSSERVFVLRGQPGTYAQVLAEPSRDHWFVARLVAPPEKLQLAADLLEAIAHEAGARGVVRLHTLVADRPDVLAWWQEAGFTPFRRVLLLAATASPESQGPDPAIRVQDAVDSWEIQRLYERSTPRPIQYAEARNRSTWQIGRRAGWRVRGFLFTGERGVSAYCRIRSRQRRHVVEFLSDEAAVGDAVRLLRYAVARCARPGDEVLALLPEDELAALPVFEGVGFVPIETRIWVARYTVRRVRAWKTVEERARLAALADAPRVLYRRDRPEVAIIERARRQ